MTLLKEKAHLPYLKQTWRFISYMLFIVYKLAEESKAGKYGMMILFVGLGLGIFGFVAKYVIKMYLSSQLV